MQGPSWVVLFKQIPVNLHDCLVLLTTTNAEVMVQRLVRLDADFVILAGRMAGTTDGARIMIMPYDQISNIAFNKKMTDKDVAAIFGADGILPAPAAALAKTPAAEEKPAEDVESEESADDDLVEANVEEEAGEVEVVAEEATPVATAAPAAPAVHPSKSILLARLRARLAGRSE